MYGLPKTFDVSFLIGREVESVVFGQYQANLNFSDRIWIQIEGPFKHFHRNELIENVDNFPISQSTLMRTLGQRVLAVNFSVNGDFEIQLSEGSKLAIGGDNGPYESYRLYDGTKETIV